MTGVMERINIGILSLRSFLQWQLIVGFYFGLLVFYLIFLMCMAQRYSRWLVVMVWIAETE